MRFFRRRQFRPITEEQAYRRSYGNRTGAVHVTKLKTPAPPTRARYNHVLERGERIRQAFADRIAQRRDA